MTSEPAPKPSRRARARRSPPRTRTVLAAALLAAGLLGAGVWGYRAWWRQHVELTFVVESGPAPTLQLDFFPDQFAFAQPSPPPPLGTATWNGAPLLLGSDLVPGSAVVRFRGAGVGTGCAHIRLGQPLPPIRLRAPATLRGRVGEPVGTWCFGWRCLGMQPVAGAEVVVMAGGEHGIDVGSARTDAEGRFVVEGVDRARDGLALRIRAPGFAIRHESLDAATAARGAEVESAIVAITRGDVCSGSVVVPAGVDATGLRVLARGLPGIESAIAADGSFRLEHLPPGVEPRLLLHGLPATWAQLPVRGKRDGGVRIEVVAGAAVRGCVREVVSGRPLAGALVFCGDGDAVRTEADGTFALRQLLPGDAEITAQHEVVDARRRRTRLIGSRKVQLVAGSILDGVELFVSNGT